MQSQKNFRKPQVYQIVHSRYCNVVLEGHVTQTKGTVKGKKGGREGEGAQYTANQGQEWTSIRTTAKEGDFQVSEEGYFDVWAKGAEKRGLATKRIIKGVANMYIVFGMYIVLIKVVFWL